MRLLLTLGFALPFFTAPASAADNCAFDRSKLLAQDLQTFDQGADGIHGLESKHPGCNAALADLVADYRKAHPEVLKNPNSYLLFWHEGQFRLNAGQDAQAAQLFEQARLSGTPVDAMWNLYVDATVAFVRHDSPALLKAHATLAGLPPERYAPDPKPMNLDVVAGLVRCFGRSYTEAYSSAACRKGQ
jgi:hypothetical protein